MWTVSKISKASDIVLGIFTGLLAAVCLVYSLYVLYDNFYQGQSAFSSWDLVRYKPKLSDDGKYHFNELQKINKDVIGWLTIYDTHIDYPVLQGKDDLEYINKDAFGDISLTGSIYLSASNHSDISDMYNIVYGHHMDNGAMFGDIDKFVDKAFFDSHRSGVYITPEKAYKLNVFACLETNAYESMIYTVNENNQEMLLRLYDYLREHSLTYYETDHEKAAKIIALSTCSSAVTNGRTVVFCDAVETEEAVAPKEEAVPADTERVVRGHGTAKGGWALLNALCVLIALYTLLPLIHTRKKYRQIQYSRKKAKELEEEVKEQETEHSEDENIENKAADNMSPASEENIAPAKASEKAADELTEEEREDIVSDLRRHVRKMVVGLIAEIVLVIAAVVVFLLTEDIFSPMILSDNFTGLMVSLAILGLIIDFVLFRYRGKLPPNKTSEEDEDKKKGSDNDQVDIQDHV